MGLERSIMNRRLVPVSSVGACFGLAGIILAMLVPGFAAEPGRPASAPAGKRPAIAGKPMNSGKIRFDEIFVTGMARLLPGGGSLTPPTASRTIPASEIRSERFIPSGSLVSTGPGEHARIRLGEKSLLKLRPESAIRIFSLSIEILQGEVCIQHGKTVFPIRLSAASSSVLLERESGADFFRPADGGLLVTIQAGSIRIPGTEKVFPSGRRLEIENGVVNPEPSIARLARWAALSRAGVDSPATNQSGETTVAEPAGTGNSPDAALPSPSETSTNDPLGEEQEQPILDDILQGHDPTVKQDGFLIEGTVKGDEE